MRIAVMQPYYFPYIGYFQLMSAVDLFILFDDVNFINGGWIHRNRILVDGAPAWLTLPLVNRSQNRSILAHELLYEPKRIAKLHRTLDHAYHSAPCYDDVIESDVRLLPSEEGSLTCFLEQNLLAVNRMLGIGTEVVRSSSLPVSKELHGEERILAICRQLGASTYLNLPGGRSLYDPENFSAHGIGLKFVEPENVSYRQFDDEFVANLSIIDVLMFNRNEAIQQLLQQYRLN